MHFLDVTSVSGNGPSPISLEGTDQEVLILLACVKEVAGISMTNVALML